MTLALIIALVWLFLIFVVCAFIHGARLLREYADEQIDSELHAITGGDVPVRKGELGKNAR